MTNRERQAGRESFCRDLQRMVEECGSAKFYQTNHLDDDLSALHDSIVILAFAPTQRGVPNEMLAASRTLMYEVAKLCREKGWELCQGLDCDGQWNVIAPVTNWTCPVCLGRGRIEMFSVAGGRLAVDPSAIFARVCRQCHGEGMVHSNVAPKVCWLKDRPRPLTHVFLVSVAEDGTWIPNKDAW